MPLRRTDNGSIHAMSLLVGELKGAVDAVTRTVEHLNNNWKMKDVAASEARVRLHEKFDELRDEFHGVKGEVHIVKSRIESVQQDVAEMKNDISVAQVTLDDYKENKTIALTAIGDVGKLKEFVQGFEKKEQRVLGWWDAIKNIGAIGWTVIGSAGAAIAGFLAYWFKTILGGH